jgi:hypothetical protein
MDNLFDDEEGDKGSEEGANGSLSVRKSPIKLGGVGGRPRKAQELAVLAAINLAFPPERIHEALNAAYDFAVLHKSHKGIMQVVEFVVAYQLGEPVKRMVTQRSTVEELLSQVADVDDEQFEGLIDALYDEHSAG